MIAHEKLRAIVGTIVAAAGSTGEEPRLVADNLVYANLTGHDSHGVGMLPIYIDCTKTGELAMNQHAEIIVDNGPVMVVDGHSGYGLALINELLAGVLSGGGTCRPATDQPNPSVLNNTLSIIIDPSRFVDSAFFESEVGATIDHVKASPPSNPEEPVLVPGDPERIMLAERTANGIPVDEETWEEILAAAESVGLDRERIEKMAL